MYTTAHRVQRGESEGINRFLHLHGEDFCWPKDASSLPEAAPGEEKRAEVELLPGGNRVRSYLDVLAPCAGVLGADRIRGRSERAPESDGFPSGRGDNPLRC